MRRSWLRRTARRVAGAAFVVGVAVWLGIAGWRVCGRFGDRCEEVDFFPHYSDGTRQIDAVMYDLNKNGIIDTWAYPQGEHTAKFDIDRDEDGAIDRILMLDRYSTVRVRPGR
jgi:hypothetical protein